jgi:16S rRNA U1498 N3-methylase RsmE
MRIPRVYTAQPLQAGQDALLPEQAGEHIVRVLRPRRPSH